jgi:hypothetical protein
MFFFICWPGDVFNGKGAVKLVGEHLYKGQFKNGKLHG